MTTLTQPASVKFAPPKRTNGFVTASSIVISNIIGTGIFTSLGFQLNNIQSGFALLMLWIVGCIAAFRGRIPFSLEYLSSLACVHGGIRVCYGWICSAGCTRRDGVWAIFQRSFRRGFAGCSVVRGCLDSHRFSCGESASRERIPERYYAREIASYRRADRGGLLCSIKTADQFLACPWRQSRNPKRGIRGRAGLRDVFLLRLECVSVYQQRDQAT